ncbi:hypothetical protein MMC07_009312 [Pseudocyphellaria aurata]|nr:hypothetical protein [Pseudocyphellaria aurata]
MSPEDGPNSDAASKTSEPVLTSASASTNRDPPQNPTQKTPSASAVSLAKAPSVAAAGNPPSQLQPRWVHYYGGPTPPTSFQPPAHADRLPIWPYLPLPAHPPPSNFTGPAPAQGYASFSAPMPYPVSVPYGAPPPPWANNATPPVATRGDWGGAGSRGGPGSRGGRGSRGPRGGRGGGGNATAVGPQAAPPEDGSFTFGNVPEGSDRGNEEKIRRRSRNRNMTPREKLILIRECCEHADEYRPGNKSKFWLMIRRLLKERTNYDLVDPRQTVTRWVETRIDELVEKEMGSGTEVERNDIKAAVEQFAGRWHTVTDEINDTVKTRQNRAAEILEAARLESSQGSNVNNEPTRDMDTPSNSPASSTRSEPLSVALALQANKRRRVDPEASTTGGEMSRDAMLLATSFRESTTVLAEALLATRQAPVAALPPLKAIPPTHKLSLEQRVDRIESALDDLRGMISRALQDKSIQKKATESGAAANGEVSHGPVLAVEGVVGGTSSPGGSGRNA